MMQRFGVYWSIMEGVAVTQKQAAHSIFWLSGRGGWWPTLNLAKPAGLVDRNAAFS